MSRKTRNLIWSVPLVATLAIVGALALFMTLPPNGAAAQQQEEVPGMPTNPQTRALDQETIELQWDAPSDEAGGVPDGYRIDYSEDGLVWYSLAPNHALTKYVDNADLEADETRQYRIFAFNSSGTSRMLGPVSETTTPSVKPEAPTALVVTQGTPDQDDDQAGNDAHVDNEHLILTWTAPVDPKGAPVTSYRVQVSKNGNSSSFFDLKELKVKDAGCLDRVCTYTHKELLESTQRWYRIYATNSVGEGPASEVRSGTTAEGIIPTAPTNLRLGLNPAGKMWLYWDQPVETDNNNGAHDPHGAPVTGYYIQGGPVAPSADINTTDPFRGPNAADTGLDPLADQDPDVDEVFYVAANTDVPLTPSVLSKLARFAGMPSPLNSVEGLRTHWGFRVMAVNRVVERAVQDGKIDFDATDPDGNWSTLIRVNNTPNQTDVLARPTVTADRHSASDRGRTGIELKWKVAGSDDQTTYRVETSDDRIDWEVLPFNAVGVFADLALAAMVDEDDEEGAHVGLTGGTRHSYRVFAVQPTAANLGAGTILSEASATISETTASPDRPNTSDFSPSGAPTAESETVIEMAVMPVGVSGAEALGFGKLEGYRVEISDDGRDWTKYAPVIIGPKLDVIYSYSEKDQKVTETNQAAPDAVVEFKHTGLGQQTSRHYRVSTVNNAPGRLAYSEPTESQKGTTHESLTSDDPGGLVTKSEGSTSIVLVWNARADDITAAEVDGYKIDSSPLNDDDECAETWTVLEANTMSTTTSYTHMGLMPETGMCYRVFGINAVGGSSGFVGFGDAYATTYDADAQAITAATMAPGMPMNVMADATSDTMTVTWEAPASDGGSDITGYMVQSAYMGADGMMTEWMDVDPPHMGMDMEYMDTGLMPETMYSYQVRAMNAEGNGEWSAAASATTTSAGTQLTAPSGVVVSSLANTQSVSVTWDTTSIQNAEQIKVVLYNSDVTALAQPLITINPANDAGSATFNNVPDGTYYVTVASFRTGERHKLSPLQEVTVE